MKVQTIKAVNAYKVLKELKVNSMSDDAMLVVWKNMKALRPAAETYDKDVEETRNTLQDDKFKEMQARLQKAQERDGKVKSEGYVLTAVDKKDVDEINTWFADWSSKGEKFLKSLAEKEIGVEVKMIDAAELLKAFKASDKTFEAMAELEWLTK
jgi:predicted transcriptional regulator